MRQELFNKILNNLSNNYSHLISYHLNDKRIELGNKVNRKCRFCGKQTPEVKFKQKTHAIPELIGNKTLISMYECDNCNAHFAQIETHFANYMALFHTLAQVSGKRGIPIYKPSSLEKSHIKMTDTGLHIEQYENGRTLFELDKNTKTFKCKGKRTYIPVMIHKCLIKMALSIMPDSKMPLFVKTIEWLNEDFTQPRYKMHNLPVCFSMYPGPRPFSFPTVSLFIRKDNHPENVPYCLFLLAYSNFVFQTFIPLCEQDLKYKRTNIQMPYIPNPLDCTNVIPQMYYLDFASTEPKKNEEIGLTFKYEQYDSIISNNQSYIEE